MRSGDLTKASQLFKRSIAAFPHPKALELLGECLIRQGQYRKALLYLGASAGLGQKPFRARFLLAQALAEMGETDDARTHLEEALRLNPDYARARQLLAKLDSVSGLK